MELIQLLSQSNRPIPDLLTVPRRLEQPEAALPREMFVQCLQREPDARPSFAAIASRLLPVILDTDEGGVPPGPLPEEQWCAVLRQLKAVSPQRAAASECNLCSVCLEGFGADGGASACGSPDRRAAAVRHRQEPVCVLPCGHHFHRKCVTEWLRRAKAKGPLAGNCCCPNCRYDLAGGGHAGSGRQGGAA